MSHDDPPPSRGRPSAQPGSPSSSRQSVAPGTRASVVPGSSRPPASTTGRSPSNRPPASTRAPLVEVISPMPEGTSGEREPSTLPPGEPPPANGPEASEATERRPLALVAGVGAMLLVPAALLAVVLTYLPRLRAWSGGGDTTSAAAVGSGEGEPTAPPEGQALVVGRVVDGEGDPVEGARVRVVGPGARAAETTGRLGHYALVVDPGRWTVVAEHDERGMVASAELPLRAGETRRDLVLTLAPVRTVRGHVTDLAGAPVAGAALRIEGPAWLQRGGQSEADGVFRIARVPALEATLRVTAPGYVVAAVKLRTGVDASDEVIDVRLAAEEDIEGTVLDPSGQPVQASVQACDGKETGQRLASGADGKFKLSRVFVRCPLVAYHDAFSPSESQLADGRQATLRLRAGGGIQGHVFDEANRPVRAFAVGVESFVPAFGDRTTLGGSEAHAFDDAGGDFRLDHLAPGSYVLTVSVTGRTPARSLPIEVRAEQVTRGVRLVLPRNGVVEGQVFDDDHRAPLPGARVSFDVTSSVRLAEAPVSATTDRSGRFRIEGAPAGPFTLRVEHEGYRTRLVTGLRVQGGDTLKQEVALHLAPDGGAPGLEFSGIGASLAPSAEGLTFGTIFEGSPAAAAGLHEGDRLRRIDGQSAEGLSLADAIQRLRGDRGAIVRLTVERPPGGEIIDLPITRGDIVR